ncbi:hypothetical protein KAFR_0G01370 [Kazachstania africana CBS 2517]|uniref:Actin patches distal protein 1 n=1 Tax=Kazachstania africana (strain ATCC 22294 / BCRC 22015 / CBS 2517 / CECT 1963 / NBRC 1671 / NRRL Y-8276) TaxID=1071382 RepID=H2AXS1_KAZAF|nr:hypothetical protein KAFR_0G01370 [Kazachstania africana CBS 2517]CCF59171.1 hypothetical protein KAFR_0G01370 [Kazachstania africana CBS 2517]
MMGFKDLLGLNKSKKDSIDAEALDDIAHEIDVCDIESICSGGSCQSDGEEDDDIKKGEEVFSKLKIDYSTPLFNSSKVPKLHFIVPTSQIDWEHDACMEKKDSVQYKINNWCQENFDEFKDLNIGDKFTCSVTSMPIDIMDIDVMRGLKNNVLILPYFIWMNDLKSENVEQTLNELVPELLKHDLNKEQLFEKFSYLSDAREKSFVFICSHTTRDKRCGITAPYMKRIFDKLLKENGLYRDNSDFRPDGVKVEFINHVGGHKFAGNVQIYLKDTMTLVWLGRVTPKDIPTIFSSLVLPENPALPLPAKVRCVKKYQKW